MASAADGAIIARKCDLLELVLVRLFKIAYRHATTGRNRVCQAERQDKYVLVLAEIYSFWYRIVESDKSATIRLITITELGAGRRRPSKRTSLLYHERSQTGSGRPTRSVVPRKTADRSTLGRIKSVLVWVKFKFQVKTSDAALPAGICPEVSYVTLSLSASLGVAI